MSERHDGRIYVLVSLLIAAGVHFWLGYSATKELAPTYDEPLHLTAGMVCLKLGAYGYNGLHHPPAAEMAAALPLLFSKAIVPVQDPSWVKQSWDAFSQYRFADRFLYKNRVTDGELMALGRRMQLSLSALLVIAIGLAGWLWKGTIAGVLSAFVAALSTSLLAHGTLVTTDFLFAASFFCVFAFLPVRQSWLGRLFLGGMVGLSAASKFSAVGIGMAACALAVWAWWKEKRVPLHEIKNIGPILAVAVVVVASFYRFSEVGLYIDGFQEFLRRAGGGRSSFFFGDHRTDGWLLYFPALIVMKTELPVLLVLLALSILAARGSVRAPARLVIPPVIYFGLALLSNVQIGHRYLLPLSPFLMVLVGGTLASFPMRWRGGLSIVVLGWMMVGAMRVRPHFLTFFNEASGGPSRVWRYFTDSNVDWGQGLSYVPAALSEQDREKGVFLSYFGVADPRAYGLKYLDVGSDTIIGRVDDSGLPGIDPTTLVISATNRQATYYADKSTFKWLDEYTPTALLANSILVYDFKNHPEAVERLRKIRGR